MGGPPPHGGHPQGMPPGAPPATSHMPPHHAMMGGQPPGPAYGHAPPLSGGTGPPSAPPLNAGGQQAGPPGSASAGPPGSQTPPHGHAAPPASAGQPPSNGAPPGSSPMQGSLPAPGPDNLNALQRAIDSMEEKGLQEDPRYSQLLALKARSNPQDPSKGLFTNSQLGQLK